LAIKRLQNKVAESRFALPIVAIYTILVWIAAGLLTHQLWGQFICMVVTAVAVMELNNRYALIRIFSRMVSCAFLVLISMANFLFPSLSAGLVIVCLAFFNLIIFHTYQNKSATGVVFHAFLCIGIASLFFIQILYLLPILWFIMGSLLVSLNKRTFFASIIGILTPYWLWGGYSIYTGYTQDIIAHFKQLIEFQDLFDYTIVSEKQIVTLVFIVLLQLIGTVHFLRKSTYDKIRTRDFYYTIMILAFTILAFILLQPQHYDTLLGLLIIYTAPLIAHFITLTQTKITNITFYIILLTTLTITIFNLWNPSLTF